MTDPQEKQTTQQQAARRIAGLLAQAESFANMGNLTARDTALAKAAALQHKYAVDQILLEQQGSAATEEIVFADFCTESNTPLIKAKRQLVSGLGFLYRGHVIMCSKWDPVKRRLDKRAYLRVHAHQSDLDWITQLYTSLVLQLQAEMAKDERNYVALNGTKAVKGWRVSYAHEWVRVVYNRLWDLKNSDERTTEPGTALALRDKGDVVRQHVENTHSLSKGKRLPTSDKNAEGRAAGGEAGRRADLGQKRTTRTNTAAVER